MAGNDTAALVIALSAQVSKFQNDMDRAISIADKSVKQIESRFAAANSAISKQLSGLQSVATSQFGGLGSILLGLGPAGIAAAVAIGGLVLAFNYAANAASELAAKSKEIRDLSENTGLTTTELQALSNAAGKVGISSETLGAGIERFTVNLDALRHGTGPLLDGLLRINPALAEQLAKTRSTADAISILSQAYRGLDIAQQNALSRAAAGRGGIELTRLFSQGIDVSSLTREFQAAGKGIDENLIQKLVDLQIQIDKTEARAKGKIASIFAVDVKEDELKYAQLKERIADRLKEVNEEVRKNGFWTTYFGQVADALNEVPVEQITAKIEEARTRITVHPGLSAENVPLPAARPSTAPLSSEFQLNLLKQEIALLGAAATPLEQLKEKRLEIAAAVEKNTKLLPLAIRAEAAFILAQGAATVAARERLGVATEEEIRTQKLRELNDQETKGYVRNAEEKARASAIIERESKAAFEAEQVRASRTPELTRALLDAGNASKQFDQIATSSFNNAGDAFADVVTGAKTVKDAVHDMVNSLVRDLSRAAFRSLLSSIFSTGTGSGVLGLFGIGRNAGGTDNWRGGPTWVGENGPEVVNLPRGSQVIPNDVVGRSVGGNGVHQTIIVSGATGNSEIENMVNRGVARANRAAAGMLGSYDRQLLPRISQQRLAKG